MSYTIYCILYNIHCDRKYIIYYIIMYYYIYNYTYMYLDVFRIFAHTNIIYNNIYIQLINYLSMNIFVANGHACLSSGRGTLKP